MDTGTILETRDSLNVISITNREYLLIMEFLGWIRKSKYSRFEAKVLDGQHYDITISDTNRIK